MFFWCGYSNVINPPPLTVFDGFYMFIPSHPISHPINVWLFWFGGMVRFMALLYQHYISSWSPFRQVAWSSMDTPCFWHPGPPTAFQPLYTTSLLTWQLHEMQLWHFGPTHVESCVCVHHVFIMLYHVFIWCVYITCFYHAFNHMMCLYDVFIWCVYMMCLYHVFISCV